VRHGRSILVPVLVAMAMGFCTQTVGAQGRPWFAGARLRTIAQKQTTPHPTAPPPRPNNFRANPSPPKAQPNLRGMDALPPKWVDNMRDMSPEEQNRFMQNNDRFQALPAQRQAQIRRNLEQWNRLSPTEQSAIRDRERTLEKMTPQQRQYVRNTLLPQWQALPPMRRLVINGRLHTLQGMTPAERQSALNDPLFMHGLSPDEQSLLRNLNSLRNPYP
jgi:hypothetical protein